MPPSLLTPPPSDSIPSVVRLAPPIKNAVILSFERRADQKTWYLVQVTSMETQRRLKHSRVNTASASRRIYTISRRYEDFYQFSQRLQETFVLNKTVRSGLSSQDVEIPKITGRIQLLPSRHVHVQRRNEIEQFIQALLQLPPSISQSVPVLEFFGEDIARPRRREVVERRPTGILRPISTNKSALRQSPTHTVHKISSQPTLPKQPVNKKLPELPVFSRTLDSHYSLAGSVLALDPKVVCPPSSSRWKRLRCASFRQRTPTASMSTSLSSVCTQAANKILFWNRQPSIPCLSSFASPPLSPIATFSTPAHGKKRSIKVPEPLTPTASHMQRRPSDALDSPAYSFSGSFSSSCISQSTTATSLHPSPSTSPTLRTIKIKVIYDADNIVVIQVPRSISFQELRSKIIQKFSDPAMDKVHVNPEFVLLFNDARSSASSSYDANPATATLICKDQDLIQAMQSKWDRLEKVTVRYIA